MRCIWCARLENILLFLTIKKQDFSGDIQKNIITKMEVKLCLSEIIHNTGGLC